MLLARLIAPDCLVLVLLLMIETKKYPVSLVCFVLYL